MADSRPNIIVFFTDQQRWDTCGCYGQRLPVTPNLDQMAAEGVRFANAFTCQPVCGPARAALQTGRYPAAYGCHTNNCALPLNATTIAHRLSTAGYEVGYIGKWHLASGPEEDVNYREAPVPPERRGGYKDYWLAADVLEFTSHPFEGHMFDADGNRVEFRDQYRVDWQTDRVLDYLDTRDGVRPFFLFLSYIEPHHQNDMKRYVGPEGSDQLWAAYDPPGDLIHAAGDWRENYPDYLGAINALDTGLGRVRGKLAEMGVADNTLIIFTSDHGSHFRTRNAEYKRSCHDGCLRIPLVACGPGFRGGEVRAELASLIDVPPTVLRAGGVKVPDDYHGRALQEAGAPDWPDDIFAQLSESQVGRCLRTRRWKYSVTRDPMGNGDWALPWSETYNEDFLYDLEADPHEQHNLVLEPGYGEVRAELRSRLLQWIARTEGQHPEIVPAVGK